MTRFARALRRFSRSELCLGLIEFGGFVIVIISMYVIIAMVAA